MTKHYCRKTGIKRRKIDIGKEPSECVGFICDLCRKDLPKDELMLNDETWEEICKKINSPYIPKETLVCHECIEKVLGRPVKLSELIRTSKESELEVIPPINYWYLKKYGYLKEAKEYILNHIKYSKKFRTATYETWIDTIELNKGRFQDPYDNELEELVKKENPKLK